MNDENREENSSSTSSVQKSRSWNETRIKLPSKYFQFMGDKKDGKGFLVKCLLCHESKTKYTKKGKIELLTITSNSGYNAKRHIKVSKVFLLFVLKF